MASPPSQAMRPGGSELAVSRNARYSGHDFAVKSDVLYLIPGEEDWGLTEVDLEAKKFEYLRKIA